MLGPIIFTKNSRIFTYAKNNEIHFSNGRRMKVHYKIHGLRSSNDKFVSFGSRFLSIFNLNGDLEKEIIIDTWIFDVLITDNIFIGTYKGEIIDVKRNLIHQIDIPSISCLSVVSPKEIICGSFDHIWFIEKYKIHKGRIFDLCINDYGFVSSGEERIVFVVDKNGCWIIQELRNYVIKCGIHKDFVYTINRDGTFKMYFNRKLIFICYSDIMCLSDCWISDCFLFLGYSHGNIKIFEMIKKHGSFAFIERYGDPYFFMMKNGLNPIENHIYSLNVSDCETNKNFVTRNFIIQNILSYLKPPNQKYVVYEYPSLSFYEIFRKKKIAENVYCFCWNKKVEYINSVGLNNQNFKLPFIPKEILSDDTFVYGYGNRLFFRINKGAVNHKDIDNLNSENKGNFFDYDCVDQSILSIDQNRRFLILLCKNKVMYIKKSNFKKYKELQISSPVISKCGLIGTKHGWIIYKTKGFKITNEPIFDLYRKENYVYCLTSTSIYVFNLITEKTNKKTSWRIKYRKKESNISFHDKHSIDILYRRHLLTYRPLRLFKNEFLFSTSQEIVLRKNNLIFLDDNKTLYAVKNHQIRNQPFMGFVNLDNLSIVTEPSSFKHITVSFLFQDYILLGTKENKVALCDVECRILDTLTLNGTISGLYGSNDSIYISTKNGILYKACIFKCKLFILNEVEADFRILDILFARYLFTVDSGGYFNIYDKDLNSIASFFLNVPLLKMKISYNNMLLSAANGCIFSFRFIDSLGRIKKKFYRRYLCRKLYKCFLKGQKSLTCIYSTDIKFLLKIKKYKLHENSIFSLAVSKNYTVCGGDDHKITVLDTRTDNLKTIIAHSGSVIDIFIQENVIFSLSGDSTVKLWDRTLNLLKVFKLSITNPTCMIPNKDYILILGVGVEKIKYDF